MIASHGPTEEFDEASYLRQNPDVAAAVKRGEFVSGRAHWLKHGQYENRLGGPKPENPPDIRFKAQIPPWELRVRVHGSEDLHTFERVGAVICDNLRATLGPRLVLSAASRVLDFGCGCGRVIVYFRHAMPGALFATDIDAEAIGWCQQNLPEIGEFSVNDAMPPLRYEDSFFDLIYSISVFTHLPQAMQSAWLAELNRVLKPGSYALLTTHGPSCLPAEFGDGHAEIALTGFYYLVRGGTAGLPDFYQDSFQTTQYTLERWSRFFEIEHIVEKGINNFQDLVICRKPL